MRCRSRRERALLMPTRFPIPRSRFAAIDSTQLRRVDLLRLMTLEHNGQVDEREWAEIIRTHLHGLGGRPTDQCGWDDPTGTKSIPI